MYIHFSCTKEDHSVTVEALSHRRGRVKCESLTVSQIRRERNIIAQREYRKRHMSQFKDLHKENARLRKALQAVLSATQSWRPLYNWPTQVRDALAAANALSAADTPKLGNSDTSPCCQSFPSSVVGPQDEPDPHDRHAARCGATSILASL